MALRDVDVFRRSDTALSDCTVAPLLGCAGCPGVTVAAVDILLVLREADSVFSAGVMLLLDLLLNRDTCVGFSTFASISLSFDFIGGREDDFLLDCAVDPSFCGAALKCDLNVEAISCEATDCVTQRARSSRRCSLGHMLCDIVGLVLGASFGSWSH